MSKGASLSSAALGWESLFRTQVAVMQRLNTAPGFRRMTARHKLSMKEYDVLFTLSRSESGSLRLNEINERILLAQSSLSRMVERLEKRGLLSRCTAPEDGRGVLISLSETGAAVQQEFGRAHVRDILAVIGSTLSEDEMRELRRLTEKVRAGLDQ